MPRFFLTVSKHVPSLPYSYDVGDRHLGCNARTYTMCDSIIAISAMVCSLVSMYVTYIQSTVIRMMMERSSM